MKPHQINILLVDDNEGDIRLMKEAFKESKLKPTLWCVDGGNEALAFLNKEDDYIHCPTPDLIILDLNMPVMTGKEFLKIVKGEPRFKIIPVIVFTISNASNDVLDAYQLHANCYISKPIDFQRFNEVVRILEFFWFDIATLPIQ